MDKKEAFIAAIKQHQGLIYKIASMYTNSIEDHDDLVQEMSYQLWRSFGSFSERSDLSTWMYRVAMNVAINHLKRAKRKPPTVSLEGLFLDFHEVDNSGMEEKWKIFRQHIDKLNLLDKGIMILYFENKSHEEIARVIGISVSNVGTKISRIKEKLKQQILKQ